MKEPSCKPQLFLLLILSLLIWGYHNSSMNVTNKDKLFSNTTPDDMNIFILAGQSNMAGRGGVTNHIWDGFVPRECSSNRRILRLNEDSKLEEAREPLHAGIDANKTCGVGPGIAFANAILKRDPNFGTIVLVPCAAGGTSIREWSSRNSSLRSRMVARTRDAVRYGGKIRAVLWYQGEKDTETEEGMRLFPSEYRMFIQRLRRELGLHRVLFIQVALASGQGQQDWLESVRATQLSMENMITVDGMGLPLGPDGLHLSTTAQVHLGNMLAKAFVTSTRP